MPARTQELKIAIGFHRQTNTGTKTTTKTQLQTALAAGDLWNLGLNAFNVPFPNFNEEDDSNFFGKGDEWVEQIFPTSIDVPWEWPYFLTSQNWAQVIAFALGAITESSPDAGAHQYVATPMDPSADGVNMPATTIVAGIRQGTADEILDMAIVGAVCTGFTLRVQRGPGLQNTSLTSRWVGCGKHQNNSGIAIPSRTQETRLGAGAASALTLNGVDYLANARFVDFEFSYENTPALDSGYFPGSGSQSGYDIRGRMRYGKRTIALKLTIELESDSSELAALLAGTEGSGQFAVQGPLISGSSHHLAQIDLPRTRFKAFAVSEADGFTVANVDVTVMKDPTDGPVILTAITDKAGILADA